MQLTENVMQSICDVPGKRRNLYYGNCELFAFQRIKPILASSDIDRISFVANRPIQPTQIECANSYAIVVSSVMCSRLCLNVRDTVKPYEMSTVRFSKFSVPIFFHATTTQGANGISQTSGTTVESDERISTGLQETEQGISA